jgi:hypothetical protein
MKSLPNSKDIELIDPVKLDSAIHMVADKTMERADLKFEHVIVKVYAAGTVLRIDVQTEGDNA